MKPSSLERRFELTVGGEQQYTLEAVSMLRREFRLRRGNVPLGGVRADSIIRRNATAQFVSEIPAEIQLFVMFLVLVLGKRAADAAAAGG